MGAGGGGRPPKKMLFKEGTAERYHQMIIKLIVCLRSCGLSTISRGGLNINSCYTRRLPPYGFRFLFYFFIKMTLTSSHTFLFHMTHWSPPPRIARAEVAFDPSQAGGGGGAKIPPWLRHWTKTIETDIGNFDSVMLIWANHISFACPPPKGYLIILATWKIHNM